MDEHDDAAGPGAPSPRASEVVRALRSVLASSAFATSRRSREFLGYVVTEQLAGRGDTLSERTVGRRALGRDALFTGRQDSSVRVRASRVRTALDAYYAGAGALDPVQIRLPRGTYAPTFHLADRGGRHDERPLGPGLVVVHFDVAGDDRARLTGTTVVEALVHRLLTFGDLAVYGPVTTTLDDPRRIAREFAERFVLQGSVTAHDGTIRLSVRLVDGSSGSTVWATSSTGQEGTGFALEDRWATELAAQLGDSAGVLHHYELSNPAPGRDSSSRAALQAFYSCQQVETPGSVRVAVTAMDRAIDEGDRSPTMLALRAWVGAAAVTYDVAEPGELDRASGLAREAAAGSPGAPLPQVALGMVALVQQEYDAAGRHGHAAAERAPHHPSVLFAAATLTGVSGDWAHAEEYAREAFRLNPRHPGQYRWLTALARLLEDDPAQALAEAGLVNTPELIWGPLYRALSLSGLGHDQQAWREMQQVLDLQPLFLDDPLAVFRSGMRVTPENAETLMRYFAPILERRGRIEGS